MAGNGDDRVKKWTVLLVWAALRSGGFLADAVACIKPLFHYALARWPAAPYRLAVLHKGELDQAAKSEISAAILNQE